MLHNKFSETISNEIVENVKVISNHVPKHNKPLNSEQFGHYLAGFIDGDGHFSSAKQLVIVFSKSYAFLAYFIKGKVGYGNVKKVKIENVYLFVISDKKGMLEVLNLINNKLRTENKFNQVINNVLSHEPYLDIRETFMFNMNLKNDLNNHWLAGFSEADAGFHI